MAGARDDRDRGVERAAQVRDEVHGNLEKYGLDAATAEVVFYGTDTDEGILFGKRKDEGTYFVKSKDGEQVYTVQKNYFIILPKNNEDYLSK